MPIYQVQLSPVDTFFFGSEKHDADLKTNYFVESGLYPQQTALLGLVRYYLLLKNIAVFSGNKITNAAEAARIIGPESFNYPNKTDFGKIQKVSPLYLLHKNVRYFFAPQDIDFDLNDELILTFNGAIYSAKEHAKYLNGEKLYAENESKIVWLQDIIYAETKAGNEKIKEGEERDEAFYRQVTRRFANNDWSFAFDISVDEESGMTEEKLFIPFGGEQSIFKMTIVSVDNLTVPKFPAQLYKRAIGTILCGSDCFIDWQLLKCCDFAVNDFVSFRNFKSTTATKNFYRLRKDESDSADGLVRSARYNLLKRGSVLYFSKQENIELACKLIEQSPACKIGFNSITVKQ